MSQYPGEHAAVSTYYLCPPGQKTFQYDEKLPSLPLPSLEQTMNKYLLSVKPHLNLEELGRTKDIVQNFMQTEGPRLQKLLETRASAKRNWLEDWWMSYGYLQLRFPISPLMNVAGPGPYTHHYLPPAHNTQIPRAALCTHFQLQHWQHMRREELALDAGKAGNEPWSMSQFRRLYNCSRRPGLHEDTIISKFKTESEGASPTHFIVLTDRRMFLVNALQTDGSICTPPQLEAVFRQIKEIGRQKGLGVGLSSLTADERTSFYHNRQHLVNLSRVNETNLSLIEDALFTVCLMDNEPVSMTQICQGGLLGPPGNTWFDKSYNAYYYANGTTISNCDHAPMDAMTSVSLCWFIDHKLIESKGVWQGAKDYDQLPEFRELQFKVDQRIIEEIKRVEVAYHVLVNSIELRSLEFGEFGKDLLRRYKIHQDSFVQVCLQAAYYKLHGKPAPTYETATTRKFYNARTETVRSCTNEAIAFAKALAEGSSTPTEKLKLFSVALKAHLQQMRECMNGQGIDRHLLGLKVAAFENKLPIPDIFTDPAFKKSGGDGNFVLSTSFVGFTSVHGGVAPMCDNGYGFFYRMGPERMVFFISSWKNDEGTNSMSLYEAFVKVAKEVVSLYQSATKPASL